MSVIFSVHYQVQVEAFADVDADIRIGRAVPHLQKLISELQAGAHLGSDPAHSELL